MSKELAEPLEEKMINTGHEILNGRERAIRDTEADSEASEYEDLLEWAKRYERELLAKAVAALTR